MNVGVVGSGKYKNKEIVLDILDQKINKEIDVVISGRSPRNNYENVDVWAEEWATECCKKKPIIYPPKNFSSFYFKQRNKKIANKSDVLLCFIPIRLYRSGTWNTINHFSKKDDFNLDNLVIYNEFGSIWTINIFPSWLLKRLK